MILKAPMNLEQSLRHGSLSFRLWLSPDSPLQAHISVFPILQTALPPLGCQQVHRTMGTVGADTQTCTGMGSGQLRSGLISSECIWPTVETPMLMFPAAAGPEELADLLIQVFSIAVRLGMIA